MRISRVYRLLRLISMLQSGRSYTAAQLAQEMDVSRRTVFRDLNMLEMAHIPYYYDHEQGTYRIGEHFFLGPINLTLSESLALLVSARRTRGSSMLPLAASGERAAIKLESVLPPAIRQYLGTIMDRVTVTPAPSARHQGLDEMFGRLLTATAENRVCRIVYISFHEHKQMRLTIEPLRVLFVGRAWYVIAWSRKHRQRRTFKLGRIRRLTVTEQTFDRSTRGPDEPGFGDAWCMIPEGKLYDVHLRFAPTVAGNVAEVNWHHSQRVEWRDDGAIDFHAHVDGLGEITWWILGYGDQVKVLAPRPLARRVADRARRVAAQYETAVEA